MPESKWKLDAMVGYGVFAAIIALACLLLDGIIILGIQSGERVSLVSVLVLCSVTVVMILSLYSVEQCIRGKILHQCRLHLTNDILTFSYKEPEVPYKVWLLILPQSSKYVGKVTLWRDNTEVCHHLLRDRMWFRSKRANSPIVFHVNNSKGTNGMCRLECDLRVSEYPILRFRDAVISDKAEVILYLKSLNGFVWNR